MKRCFKILNFASLTELEKADITYPYSIFYQLNLDIKETHFLQNSGRKAPNHSDLELSEKFFC